MKIIKHKVNFFMIKMSHLYDQNIKIKKRLSNVEEEGKKYIIIGLSSMSISSLKKFYKYHAYDHKYED